MKNFILIPILCFIAGVLVAVGMNAFAQERIGVTDVRVGQTAAIALATSADGEIVYVVNGNGMFKSIDGGINWRKLLIE